MYRLPLADLQEAQENPQLYKEKLTSTGGQGVGGYGYYNALRDAALKYHSGGNDASLARSFLEEKLDKFKNTRLCQKTADQLEWYLEEYTDRGWPAFQTRLNITIPISSWIHPMIKCSGQISRIDIVPAGGYAAWLFRKEEPDGWFNELRMPLIQDVLGRFSLKVGSKKIQVGIYSFEEQYVDSRRYSSNEIDGAYNEFNKLMKQLS